ncbi:Uncharacterized phage protein gp47/JayE [Paenibacillaceae bacterium GAS479]|nr:Uncharacterized phage protein gp47/JayE [Paenibacillaceae bacterium GAS479]
MDEQTQLTWQQLLDSIGDTYDKSEGYLVSDIFKSVAIVIKDLRDELEAVKAQLNVETLAGDMLAAFIEQRKGIVRNKATYSQGVLTITGNGQVNIGDLFETKSGVQFKANEAKMIAGTGTIKVVCTVVGAVGNVPANQITMMPVTLPGITSITNNEPTIDGYEAESDESLRERYYIALSTPATSGNVHHYLQWAKDISGVGDARVFPVERGANTVEVVIINQDKQPASTSLVNEIQAYIDPGSTGLGNGQAPIGTKCYVVSASGLTINISLTVIKSAGYTNAQVQSSIASSITSYLKSIAFNSDYVSYAKIGEAILNSNGVADYSNLKVNNGTANISIGLKQVAVLGGVTVA